jgi:hypothetical protein
VLSYFHWIAFREISRENKGLSLTTAMVQLHEGISWLFINDEDKLYDKIGIYRHTVLEEQKMVEQKNERN